MTQLKLEERLCGKESKWTGAVSNSIKNYLIDTSAKVGAYALPMALMESCNGLDASQVLASRATAAVVDAGVARIYGKARDFVRNKVHAEKSAVRSYLADTLTMIATYTPVYAAILKANGATNEQTAYSLVMGAGIAALTARPYGKYILEPWRRFCKKKAKI